LLDLLYPSHGWFSHSSALCYEAWIILECFHSINL
jgi:hypothetical protein